MIEQIWSLELANSIVDFLQKSRTIVFVEDKHKIRSLSLRVEHKLNFRQKLYKSSQGIEGACEEIIFKEAQLGQDFYSHFDSKMACLLLPEQVLNAAQLERGLFCYFEGPCAILYHSALTARKLQSKPNDSIHLKETWGQLCKIFYHLRCVLNPRQLSYFLKGWHSSEITSKSLHWHPHFARCRQWDFSDLLELCLWFYKHL